MKATSALKCAVIGVGANAYILHLPALTSKLVDIVAVCDTDIALGSMRARELGCPHYFDYKQMLTDTEPDVTVIMTPHPLHCQMAINAMQSGSHVLVEKPMAVSVAEADQMIRIADECEKQLAVCLQHRYRPVVNYVRQMIVEHKLGTIQRVELVEPCLRTAAYYRSTPWRGTWASEGGGVLLNQAPHALDLMCFLVGLPKRLCAFARTLRHDIETEDTAVAVLEWESGILGLVYASTAEAGRRRIEITGTLGHIELTSTAMVFERFDTDLSEYISHNMEWFSEPELRRLVTIYDPGGNRSSYHELIYRDLHAAIVDGSPLGVDGRQGCVSLEIANAMIYSSHTNRIVELPLNRRAYGRLLENLRRGKQ